MSLLFVVLSVIFCLSDASIKQFLSKFTGKPTFKINFGEESQQCDCFCPNNQRLFEWSTSILENSKSDKNFVDPRFSGNETIRENNNDTMNVLFKYTS